MPAGSIAAEARAGPAKIKMQHQTAAEAANDKPRFILQAGIGVWLMSRAGLAVKGVPVIGVMRHPP
jgi:Na+/H+ antiporter NhaB